MFSVTVAEASTKLGVSPARVRQLIKSGILAAEQVAGIWLIDEKSVEARREHNPGRGRPSARLSQPNASHYLLMNRDHEVLAFRFDASTGEFLDADEIIDAKRAPLSIMSPRGTKASKTALSYWWRHRAIPKARHGIEAKLVELGIADTYDLPFKKHGTLPFRPVLDQTLWKRDPLERRQLLRERFLRSGGRRMDGRRRPRLPR